jgi:hypothetical protein
MPNPPVDIDWLISRIDNAAEKYPGLALVMIPSVEQFTEENSFCGPAEATGPNDIATYFPKDRNHHKYQHQFYGNSLLDKDALVFPFWNFGYSKSKVFKAGCWAMWLCRKHGTVREIQDDMACLDTYRILFGVCTNLLGDFYKAPIFPWPEKGMRGELQYDLCLSWLLFLLSHVPQRKDFEGIYVIDDVGIASGMALRMLRDELDGQTEAPPQAPVAVPVEGSSEKQTFEEAKTIGDRKTTPKKNPANLESLVNKLRQRIANDYVYVSYVSLCRDIGGSNGTWTNIFRDPENRDLVDWKENRSVYARNSPSMGQQSYEDEEFLPDEDLEPLFIEEHLKGLPKEKRQEALAQFREMPKEKQKKLIRDFR